jgi:hypothetical protein
MTLPLLLSDPKELLRRGVQEEHLHVTDVRSTMSPHRFFSLQK